MVGGTVFHRNDFMFVSPLGLAVTVKFVASFS